jgi:hypothetical protein
MMTIKQWLLLKVAEECTEVAHRALKTIQFGIDEIQPGQPYTNLYRLEAELLDLAVIVSLLNNRPGVLIRGWECFNLKLVPLDARVKKVEKYLQMSQDLGEVEQGDI